VDAGAELVRRLMRSLGLVACQPRPWRPVTTVAGDAATIPDLVRRDFTAAAPGTKLVGDITYSAQLAVMCSCAGLRVWWGGRVLPGCA
jgi:transposase InsO family protein